MTAHVRQSSIPYRMVCREAIFLASFMATLLAPFMTGLLIEMLGSATELINGISALVGALLELPGTLALVWISFYVLGRLAHGVNWRCALFLMASAAAVGGCVALFRLDVIDHLNTRQGQIVLDVFLMAGALTGAAYVWLMWFCDRLLKALSE